MGQKYPSSAMDRRSRFPAGRYAGSISESKDDQNEDGTAGSVSFRLINNVAVDAVKEPGARICFIRIAAFMTVKDKRGREQTLMTSDVGEDETDDENIPFQLRLAVGMFMMLAVALGEATDEEGTVEFKDSLESFIDALRDGEFDGVEIEFIVTHRQYIAKRGANKGNVVKVEDVSFPAPEEEEGGGGETEPEPEPEPEDKPRLRKGAKASARAEAKKDDGGGDGEDEKPKGSGRPKFVRRSKATK